MRRPAPPDGPRRRRSDGRRRPRAVRRARVAARLERARERQVQLRPLAGEQVVLDASRRSAWRNRYIPSSWATRRWPSAASRSASRSVRGSSRSPPPRADGRADDRPRRAAAAPARVRQPLDAQHQRVAQRVRRRAAAVEPGRQQLLAEQRVAAGARPQPLQQVGSRRGADDVGQQLGELVAGERREAGRAARAGRVPAPPVAGAAGGRGAPRRIGRSRRPGPARSSRCAR